MFRFLHKRWVSAQLQAAVAHATSSALYAKAAVVSAGPKGAIGPIAGAVSAMNDSYRRKAAVLGAFECAHSLCSFAESGESYESWVERGGHVDYIEALLDSLLDEYFGDEEVEHED